MSRLNASEQYMQQSVMTASGPELTLMLYNGMIKWLKLAKISITNKDIDASNSSLQRCQDIATELISSLDLNYGIAQNLLVLYDFVRHELVEVNLRKDADRIDPLLDILVEIRDAWQQAMKLSRQSTYSEE